MKISRVAGRKLAFLDLLQDFYQVQVVCNVATLQAFSGASPAAFKTFLRLCQRGDIFCEALECYI